MRSDTNKHASIISVSPFRCRMWTFHDRLEEHITEESCKNEIRSFEENGQLVPVVGRPLYGEAGHDFELIFGARRLFIARHLNIPLLLESRELSDREAFIAMDIENRHRQDISPYERGMSYARWIRSGHFKSQDDVARALRISASTVSRLLKLARLPSVVVGAFRSPNDICEGWGVHLADLLESEQHRQAILRRARVIAELEQRPDATEVFRRLQVATAKGTKLKQRMHDDIVKDELGRPLFRIRYQRSSVALLLPTDKISTQKLLKIRLALIDAMHSDERGSVIPKLDSHRCMDIDVGPLIAAPG